MARFLCGLNRDIRCFVKLQHYESLEDMVHQAKKAERPLERKHSYKKTYHYDSSSDKDKSKKEGYSPSKQQGSKSQSGKHVPNHDTSSTSRSGSIKCFKWLGKGHIALHCPNKKTNFLRENEIAISDFSSISSSYISSDNDSRCGTKYLDDGLMMCKRLLGIQCKDKDEIQKKNIFQTRCLVLGNVCSLIIDGGSYINVSNTRLVSRLNLKTTHMP